MNRFSMEPRPLSGFYNIDADFFETKMHFYSRNYKQSSKFQSGPIRALIASQSTLEK